MKISKRNTLRQVKKQESGESKSRESGEKIPSIDQTVKSIRSINKVECKTEGNQSKIKQCRSILRPNQDLVRNRKSVDSEGNTFNKKRRDNTNKTNACK